MRGPLGLILFSFSISPTSGRAAAAAAGHGFLSGWTLAIIGDMLFFGVLMATTLWVTSVFGDSRQLIGAVAIGAWVLPLLIRRLRAARRARLRVSPRHFVCAAQARRPSSALWSGATARGAAAPGPRCRRRKRLSRADRRTSVIPGAGLHR